MTRCASLTFAALLTMEVDFLCAEVKLVIEVDGAQHLSDSEPYRRDRRKDALLQENGYFVLRFLAEDLGKRLDDVLDTILRTLTHRRWREAIPSAGKARVSIDFGVYIR